MDKNTTISINKKRNADEMESNQPNEVRTVKIQRIESEERKYQEKIWMVHRIAINLFKNAR